MKKLYAVIALLLCIPIAIWAQGNDCSDPIIVTIPASLPYSDLNQTTCGHINSFSNTSLGNFKGEDIIYELNVTAQTEVNIILDPGSYTGQVGVLLTLDCPTHNNGLIWNSGNGLQAISYILNPGTYRLLVDSKNGDCISSFDLLIEEIIPPPEFEIRLTENISTGLMDVQMREITGNINITTSTQIDDIDFAIRWAPGTDYDYSTDVTVVCTDYAIVDKNDPYSYYYTGTPNNPNYFLRVFTVSGGSFNSPENWTTNAWYTIASLRAVEIVYNVSGTLTVITSDASGWDYEIAPDGWLAASEEADPLIEIGSASYDPAINGDVTGYQMPTIVDFTWEGGDNTSPYDGYSWENPANWRNLCGSTEVYPPGPLSNCIIPAGKSQYPRYPLPDNSSWNMSWCKTLTIENGGEVNWEGGTLWNYLMAWDNFDIQNGGDLTINQDGSVVASNLWTPDNDINGSIDATHVDTYLRSVEDLNINNTNSISMLGWMTVNGDTYIGAPEALVLKSNNTGSGSFLNDGSISYSATGTAQVETYISGIGNPLGAVYMHFAGPTVLDIAYRNTSNTGVRLEQFNMTTLDTYAYEWDSNVDTTIYQPWVNVWPYDYNVTLANGLAITNYVAENGTMLMEGSLITGSFSTYTIQNVANNSIELISNPYPTAIDFNEFYNDNSDRIENKYNIMNATDNWTQYVVVGGSGVPAEYQYIQMGQGFMVLPTASGVQLQFNDDIRMHNDVAFRSHGNGGVQLVKAHMKAFEGHSEKITVQSRKHETDVLDWIKKDNPLELRTRDITPNQLTMKVYGGEHAFNDQLSIYFWEGASMNYDEDFGSIKWKSMNADATMIRSITSDNFEMAVNALPLEKLNVEMVSVPIQFECGYEGEYTLAFNELDSFEEDTEIWLEDIQEDNYWFNVTPENNIYLFNASADDEKDRFLLHFFGPTGNVNNDISESEEEISIYSFKNDVYVINNSDEIIKDIVISDLLGRKVYGINTLSSTLNKIKVSENTAYYIVKVLTDKNIYSKKVFIVN